MDSILEQLINEHISLVEKEKQLLESKASQEDIDANDLATIKSYRKLIRHLDEHYNLTTEDLDKILFDIKTVEEAYMILGNK